MSAAYWFRALAATWLVRGALLTEIKSKLSLPYASLNSSGMCLYIALAKTTTIGIFFFNKKCSTSRSIAVEVFRLEFRQTFILKVYKQNLVPSLSGSL